MIYIDTSVALAHILAEDRRPRVALWSEPLISSRLLEYELWTRICARGLMHSHAEVVGQMVARISFLEMIGEVLVRAKGPFATPLRTLDALHLSSLEFVRAQGVSLMLASYDERQIAAARALGIPLAAL